jgi:hypothetical protein
MRSFVARVVALSLAAAGLLILASAPSYADTVCQVTDPETGVCLIYIEVPSEPGNPGDEGDDGPKDTGSGARLATGTAPSRTSSKPPPGPVPCTSEYGYWSNSYRCYISATSTRSPGPGRPELAGRLRAERRRGLPLLPAADGPAHLDLVAGPTPELRAPARPRARSRSSRSTQMNLRAINIGIAPKPRGRQHRHRRHAGVDVGRQPRQPHGRADHRQSASAGGITVTATAQSPQDHLGHGRRHRGHLHQAGHAVQGVVRQTEVTRLRAHLYRSRARRSRTTSTRSPPPRTGSSHGKARADRNHPAERPRPIGRRSPSEKRRCSCNKPGSGEAVEYEYSHPDDRTLGQESSPAASCNSRRHRSCADARRLSLVAIAAVCWVPCSPDGRGRRRPTHRKSLSPGTPSSAVRSSRPTTSSRVRLSADPALKPVAATSSTRWSGNTPRMDIAAGAMLTPDSLTTPRSSQTEGQSVVGVALTPAQAPGLGSGQYGDRVRVVVTPAQGEELPAGRRLFSDATVVGVHVSEETGQSVVDLLVPHADAAVLAARGSPPATSPWSWTRGSADGRHRSHFRVRLARRHHHGARAGSALATSGPVGRGRSHRRLRLAGGLLPGHPRVRRRAHRAGTDCEQPQRRAGRDRPVASRAPPSPSSPAPGRTPRRPRCEICGTPLADELADLERTGQDVIVDAGRLGLLGSPEPLLAMLLT